MKRMLTKFLTTFAVALFLIVGLGIIGRLADDRNEVRRDVVAEVTRGNGGTIDVLSPLLCVTVEEAWSEKRDRQRVVRGPQGDSSVVVGQDVVALTHRQGFVVPVRTLLSTEDVRVETRYRGIMPARAADVALGFSGEWSLPAELLKPEHTAGSRRIVQTSLVVALESAPTLATIDRAVVAEQPVVFSAGVPDDCAALLSAPMTAGAALSPASHAAGLHAVLAGAVDAGKTYPFAVQLHLRGGQDVRVRALAANVQLTMNSNWPHPSFSSERLPTQRALAADKSSAVWNFSGLGSGLKNYYLAPDAQTETQSVTTQSVAAFATAAEAATVSVAFVDPTDTFARVERALKYGFLFIMITLGLVNLIEVLKRLRAHPVQYLLVSASLVMFFLLLLALTEHLAFGVAYAVAASAVVLLNGIYLTAMLQSTRTALVFSAALTSIYAALYGVLVSEDNALLMGTALLFAVLSAVMVLTRRVNWFDVFSSSPAVSARGQ